MGKIRRALGLMSGTSMDGIDLALLETDGQRHVRRIQASSVAYSDDCRARLRGALADALTLTQRDQRPGCLAAVETELTALHADAVRNFVASQPTAIDVIGFHGQTVLHRPEIGLTVQLGDGPALAAATGIQVVHDLRAADCAAGGQGAPLVPVYHRALVAKVADRPIAIVNIGGVANITWIGRGGELIAFDTGPGNAMIDDWMMKRTGAPRDDGGTNAARGRAHEDYVSEYLRHNYFPAPVPKSLDRNAFNVGLVEPLSTEDGAATLAAFTAAAIAKAREHVPEEPQLWVISGGGRRNRTLMGMIAGHVHGAVVPAEALGLDGDAVEAEAWAYLAVRSLDGRPITFPGTTGVATPLTGGVLSRP